MMERDIEHINHEMIIKTQSIRYHGLKGVLAILEAYYLMDIDSGRTMVMQVCELELSDNKSIINNLVLEMIDLKWILPVIDVLTIALTKKIIDRLFLVYIIEYCRTRVHDMRSEDIARTIERELLKPDTIKEKISSLLMKFRKNK